MGKEIVRGDLFLCLFNNNFVVHQRKATDLALDELLLTKYGGEAEIPIVRLHRIKGLQEKLFLTVF
jgi:hypothetical protein